MRMIISAGGTGGHIYPALAIIKKFQEKEKNFDVIYIGTHNRMEKDIVPEAGYKYVPIEIYGFSKTNMVRNVKNVYLINKAKKKCLEIIKEFKPDIVIGVGGYVTYPVIWAAKKLGVKTFIHEQNSIPGKANKLIAKGVDLVGISFSNSKQYFRNAKKVIYTGNPCGSNALTIPKISKTEFGVKKDSKTILIAAGSLGSGSLNEILKVFLCLVGDDPYEFIYVTGKAHYDEFMANSDFPKNVHIVPYIDNMAGLMKDIDLMISRAGASTISEILALKVPSIMIPSPNVANNHQYYNALDLSNLKVSILLEEKELNPEKLLIEYRDVMQNKIKDLKKNLDKVNKESSGDIIYKSIKEIIWN